MTGAIDEISEAIGKLQSTVDHILKGMHVIDGKVDTLNTSSILQQSSIKSAHERIDILAPIVKDHETLKNKGVGVFSFISVVASFVGVFIGAIISKILPW